MASEISYTAEEVADRLAIQDVLSRYVHALDDRDIEALDDVFMPDAAFDLSSAGGMVASWPQIKEYFKTGHPSKFELDFHLFSNTKIQFDQGRHTATTRSKVFNPRGTRQPDGSIVFSIAVGVYQDEWRKTGNGWRICTRTWYRAFAWDAGDERPGG